VNTLVFDDVGFIKNSAKLLIYKDSSIDIGS
jgi:hypothetical protein